MGRFVGSFGLPRPSEFHPIPDLHLAVQSDVEGFGGQVTATLPLPELGVNVTLFPYNLRFWLPLR